MKNVFVLAPVIFMCLFQASCGLVQKQMAVNFNDTLVNLNQSIVASAQVWGDSLTQCKATGEYAKLAGLREQMENDIQRLIDRVAKMHAPGNGGEEFKGEELIFLKLEKRVIHDGFKPFESLTQLSTDSDKQLIYDGLTGLIKDEQAEVDKLNKQQQLYAHANNFSIVQNGQKGNSNGGK